MAFSHLLFYILGLYSNSFCGIVNSPGLGGYLEKEVEGKLEGKWKWKQGAGDSGKRMVDNECHPMGKKLVPIKPNSSSMCLKVTIIKDTLHPRDREVTVAEAGCPGDGH